MALSRATTELQAANNALAHLRQPPVSDLNLDNTRARVMKQHFGGVRDALLRAYPWNFAKGWEVPAEGTAPAAGTFTRRFPLPADVLAVRFVKDLEADEWTVEQAASGDVKALLTDAEAPTVCITRRIESPVNWDETFLPIFELKLAARGAPQILKSNKLARDLNADADAMLLEAKRLAAKENAPSTISRETSWITARRVGG